MNTITETSSAQSLARVRDEIAAACAEAKRDPASVTLIAVSKTFPADAIEPVIAADQRVFGENRVQEAKAKWPALRAAHPGLELHLIGPLQSNKARRALETFDLVQSVDSADLARRLDRLASEARPGARVPILLQVNVDDDAAKAGFELANLQAELDEILVLPRLEVRGLMTIGRLVGRAEEARPTFRALRELSERLRGGRPRLGEELSMGMSADFEVAVEEGATIVRVGQALFGERPHEHPGRDNAPGIG